MKVCKLCQETYADGSAYAFLAEVQACGLPSIIARNNGLPRVSIADHIAGAITVELCKEYLRAAKSVCPDVNRIDITIGDKDAIYKEAENCLVIKIAGRFVYENRNGIICRDPDAYYCG